MFPALLPTVPHWGQCGVKVNWHLQARSRAQLGFVAVNISYTIIVSDFLII